jgi:hypothetical protein
MQTRLGSFVEACLNIAIGYTVAILAQMAIFPLFDIHISHAEHHMIGVLFTLVSLVRSYSIRRLFNWLHVREHE